MSPSETNAQSEAAAVGAGPPLKTISESYTYDGGGRLTNATYNDLDKISYTYDAAGNIENVSVEVVTLTAVAENGSLPHTFALHANYPNPFNPSTVIRYDLPEMANVELAVFDISGRRIKTLLRQEQAAGYHRVSWDADADSGAKVVSGVYFVQMVADNFRQIQRVVLLK